MANLVVDRADLFPVGTTVDARAGHAIVPGALVGVITESEVVASNGRVTFTGLTDGAPYVLTATVAGDKRRLLINKGEATFTPAATWKARVAARRAAIGTS